MNKFEGKGGGRRREEKGEMERGGEEGGGKERGNDQMTKWNPPLPEVTQISKEAADATAHYSENHHLRFMLKGSLRHKGLGKRVGLIESQG